MESLAQRFIGDELQDFLGCEFCVGTGNQAFHVFLPIHQGGFRLGVSTFLSQLFYVAGESLQEIQVIFIEPPQQKVSPYLPPKDNPYNNKKKDQYAPDQKQQRIIQKPMDTEVIRVGLQRQVLGRYRL